MHENNFAYECIFWAFSDEHAFSQISVRFFLSRFTRVPPKHVNGTSVEIRTYCTIGDDESNANNTDMNEFECPGSIGEWKINAREQFWNGMQISISYSSVMKRQSWKKQRLSA